ncbi:MAG: terminase gpA endonuclease subunit [Desulfobacterales bacterium]
MTPTISPAPSGPIRIDPRWLAPEDRGALRAWEFSWTRGEKKRLRKRAQIPVSEWCERHRVVVKSSVPGLWRNRTTPYLAGIMDASYFRTVEGIVVCAAPQVGKSELVNNCIGYAIDRDPADVLYVYPDELTSREKSVDGIRPMIQTSRRLSSYTTGYQDDLGIFRMNLQHMTIYLAWAGSPSRLASKPIGKIVFDETDKYPVTSGKREAGPIDLGKKRLRTYKGRSKWWMTSSPSTEDGPIWQALETECDCVFDYWARCPECGGYQRMLFSEKDSSGGTVYWIRVPDGERDGRKIEAQQLAWYQCRHCAARWNDAMRDQAVRGGQWRDRDLGRELFAVLEARKPRTIGFHLPAWVSPFVSFSTVMRAWFDAQGNFDKLKDFMNGYAAEPWRHYQKEREESRILMLRDDRPRGRVPGGGRVACLMAGVDTQDVGCWYRIRAFGWGGKELSRESWGVRCGFVETEADLERVLFEDKYFDAEGNEYVVAMAIRDALGHRTSDVYDFCVKHRGRVFPSFGRDTMPQPFSWGNLEYYPGTKKPIPGGLKSITVNTKFFKDRLARFLEIHPGDPSAFHLEADFTEAEAAHYTAEYVNEKGLWACPAHKPNHLWDCEVLAMVAHEVMGVVHWTPQGKKPQRDPSPEPASSGGWINGGGGGSWLNRR